MEKIYMLRWNLFRVKLGGPCARYHPSVSGGFGSSPARLRTAPAYPGIFISDDNGGYGKELNHNATITGNTVCIQVHPKFPDEIWVGVLMKACG